MSATPDDDRPPRLAFGMYKRFLLGALVVVLASAATVSTAALLEIKDDGDIFFKNSTGLGREVKGALDGVDPGGPQTILLLGSDQRYIDIKQKNPVRSDTIILLRLDPSKGATSVMSIPRDLKVAIPGHGTDKINAAYAIGGPALSVKTIRNLLHIPITHVVNINFGGFRRAVDRLGCVYTDVDRRYFNDNSPPFGGGGDYATIDVKAGYQKLCGQDALDFVRYRHFDTDLVRAARQQQFLADAKDQIGVGKLFSDRKALLKIFGRYTQTDISSDSAILRLLKLAFESAQKPVQEVRFPGDIGGDYVTVTPENLAAVTKRFMNAEASKKPAAATTTTAEKRPSKKSKSSARSTALPPGMIKAGTGAEDEAVRLATKLPFSVYYPTTAIAGAQLLPDHSRAYDIYDRGGHKYRAYRMVIKTEDLGQYYGVQGTSWGAPPILDNPSERRRMAGRTYQLFYDGSRLRLVSWRSGKAVYWISNTLLSSIGNKQMLAMARSVGRIR
ncbi:Polyisoprenyl-teichoic acid--peptidoglycan teichoic acid transferase TagU [Baekduia alba]|uniref:LCP family protein n=1 Tax=Baekduia alba TaxID=2997333 RepID=UPI002341015F|nr:LCP family protein [Baekduia alba]WCB92761.1 Polyisoprenyl-teichoic acid--peptidoglycan teichoic acid transferase TagU [Baekduia alba]